jgi:hypothetical protein
MPLLSTLALFIVGGSKTPKCRQSNITIDYSLAFSDNPSHVTALK